MRINIVINGNLMEQAIELSGFSTKKAVVEEALKLFIHMKKQVVIRGLRGKLKWEGDLDQMRSVINDS